MAPKFSVIHVEQSSSGTLLGTLTNVPVNITDNDFGLQFQFPTNTVAEDAGCTVIRVVRDDDGAFPSP